MTTRETCHLCTRPTGLYSCREVPLGWYCLQQGLQVDQTRLIAPTPDSVGRREQKVIDEFAPLLAEHRTTVDNALEAYTVVQQVHHRALLEAQQAGCSGLKSSVVDSLGGVPVGSVPGRRKPPSEAEKAKLGAAEEQARDALEEAEHKLSRARVRLNGLEQQHDHARRRARNSDRT